MSKETTLYSVQERIFTRSLFRATVVKALPDFSRIEFFGAEISEGDPGDHVDAVVAYFPYSTVFELQANGAVIGYFNLDVPVKAVVHVTPFINNFKSGWIDAICVELPRELRQNNPHRWYAMALFKVLNKQSDLDWNVVERFE